MDHAEGHTAPKDSDDTEPQPASPPGRRSRRPYETPRLIQYGHVKQLTAGAKVGVIEGGLTGSIA